MSRISRVRAFLAVAFASGGIAQAALNAPNVVEITPRLVTSGQPAADMLGKLKAEGFEAVIYLAPPTVMDAVKDEALIVARQGITFINIPVNFGNPTEADFQQFAAILKGMASRKVLVHCQVNMRASSFVFLYRTTVLHEDPKEAYKAVSQVWAPHGPWRTLIEEQLRKNDVKFEIL